jgi:hypothetical protein
MNDHDRKKLWGRSGNLCSFPGCGAELIREGFNRALGEEAHIKGEKPGSPRYDALQPQEERDSYENRILLCPTHHTEIDADEAAWTVTRLYEVKLRHERDVERNRQFPDLLSDLRDLVQRYDGPARDSAAAVHAVLESGTRAKVVRVDAAKEDGVDSGIAVRAGQRVVLYARGLITYDSGSNFANPEGILCDALGMPRLARGESGDLAPVVWPHPDAYPTDGGELGRIGSLIGWIGEDRTKAFRVGARRELVASTSGRLRLAINDSKGSYGDNDGEYRVDILIAG